MKPREFIERFKAECDAHDVNAHYAWQAIPPDELNWLAEDDQGDEWLAFKHLLNSWRAQFGIAAPVHDHDMPNVNCFSCCHHAGKQSETSYCLKFNKAIPESFNRLDACKEWNA